MHHAITDEMTVSAAVRTSELSNSVPPVKDLFTLSLPGPGTRVSAGKPTVFYLNLKRV